MTRPLLGKILLTAAILSALFAAVAGKVKAQTLREWFNSLSSPAGGVCCHNFDGLSLEEDTWRTANGGYQVLINGKWVDVPPGNVVNVPNRLGRAHLWLKGDGSIRCFIPGSLG